MKLNDLKILILDLVVSYVWKYTLRFDSNATRTNTNTRSNYIQIPQIWD
jgi:hypothetical protein